MNTSTTDLGKEVKLRIHRERNGGETYYEVGPIHLDYLKRFVMPTISHVLDDLNKGLREIHDDGAGAVLGEWKLQVCEEGDDWRDWSAA